jgi:hypothetical protein
MTISEILRDSEQNRRWIAWEENNRRSDRITEKRVTLVFIIAGVILVMAVLYVLV